MQHINMYIKVNCNRSLCIDKHTRQHERSQANHKLVNLICGQREIGIYPMADYGLQL